MHGSKQETTATSATIVFVFPLGALLQRRRTKCLQVSVLAKPLFLFVVSWLVSLFCYLFCFVCWSVGVVAVL